MKKILLVEDNVELNKTIKIFLELNNFDVDSKENGEEALNIIQENNYDLYLIDINLPNINGLDILKEIRNKNKDIPIIMMTADFDVKPFIDAFENGCSEYIKKPFYFEELEIRINRLLDNPQAQVINKLKIDNKTKNKASKTLKKE